MIAKIDFETLKKDNQGLVPVIVQDVITLKVLMLGYMNNEAFLKTKETKRVTFWSRSRMELWEKGASSGNYLHVKKVFIDCDSDALLIHVTPDGPTCHTGKTSCFDQSGNKDEVLNHCLIDELINVINERFTDKKEGSYVQSLIEKGIAKIAQKVGEEGVELVIEAMRNEPILFNEEAADLFFHYLILLRAKGIHFNEILSVLESRMKEN